MGITVARTRYLQAPGEQWPDASNTGVPVGTSLTPVSGNLFTSSNGQTIDALDITDGSIVVDHDNVVITRCRISSNSFGGIFLGTGASGTLTIEDCEIECQNVSGSTGLFYDPPANPTVTMRRCNIHSCENGLGIGASGLDVQDSWFHDFNPAGADPHTDGIQCSAGTDNVTIVHNNFELDTGGHVNSCVQMNTTTVDQTNWLVENNRMVLSAVGASSGAMPCRLPTGDATGNNVRFIDNRLTPGEFGYVTPTPPGDHITEWSAVDDDTGDPVP